MTKNILMAALKKLVAAGRSHRTKIVIMGGLATSVHSLPRATFDVDCIARIPEDEISRFLRTLSRKGFDYDKKHPVKLIQGLPYITLRYSRYGVHVDIFLAANEFQRQIITRSQPVRVNDIKVNIISAEDLILVKLLTGRSKDTEDVRQIILENRDSLNFTYLRKWVKRLGVGVFLRDELKSLRIKFPQAG